jgi:ATP-dependent RNA helicase RhlE
VMPQERSDARKMERELKITFDWRITDKNIAKEERNTPIDTGRMSDVMTLETRAWKTNPAGTSLEDAPVPSRRPSGGGGRPSGGGGFGRRRPGGPPSGGSSSGGAGRRRRS